MIFFNPGIYGNIGAFFVIDRYEFDIYPFSYNLLKNLSKDFYTYIRILRFIYNTLKENFYFIRAVKYFVNILLRRI